MVDSVARRGRVAGRDEAGEAGARGKGSGLGSWRPGKGFRPLEAGARGRVQASGSWRPGKGRGRLVHGPCRLWPGPRRPGMKGAEGSSPEGHGSATGPSPKSDLVTEMRRRSLFLTSSSDVA